MHRHQPHHPEKTELDDVVLARRDKAVLSIGELFHPDCFQIADVVLPRQLLRNTRDDSSLSPWVFGGSRQHNDIFWLLCFAPLKDNYSIAAIGDVVGLLKGAPLCEQLQSLSREIQGIAEQVESLLWRSSLGADSLSAIEKKHTELARRYAGRSVGKDSPLWFALSDDALADDNVIKDLSGAIGASRQLEQYSLFLSSLPAPLFADLAVRVQKIIPACSELTLGGLRTMPIEQVCTVLTSMQRSLQSLNVHLGAIEMVTVFAAEADRLDFCRCTFDSRKPEHISNAWHLGWERGTIGADGAQQRASGLPDVRHVFITGDNMAGKTFALEREMLVRLCAQRWGWAPAESANIHLRDCFVWVQQLPPDHANVLSAFCRDARHTADALGKMTEARAPFAVFDEMYSTTSYLDQYALVCAYLEACVGESGRTISVVHNELIIRAAQEAERREAGRVHIAHASCLLGPSGEKKFTLEPGVKIAEPLAVAAALGMRERFLGPAMEYARGSSTDLAVANLDVHALSNDRWYASTEEAAAAITAPHYFSRLLVPMDSAGPGRPFLRLPPSTSLGESTAFPCFPSKNAKAAFDDLVFHGRSLAPWEILDRQALFTELMNHHETVVQLAGRVSVLANATTLRPRDFECYGHEALSRLHEMTRTPALLPKNPAGAVIFVTAAKDLISTTFKLCGKEEKDASVCATISQLDELAVALDLSARQTPSFAREWTPERREIRRRLDSLRRESGVESFQWEHDADAAYAITRHLLLKTRSCIRPEFPANDPVGFRHFCATLQPIVEQLGSVLPGETFAGVTDKNFRWLATAAALGERSSPVEALGKILENSTSLCARRIYLHLESAIAGVLHDVRSGAALCDRIVKSPNAEHLVECSQDARAELLERLSRLVDLSEVAREMRNGPFSKVVFSSEPRLSVKGLLNLSYPVERQVRSDLDFDDKHRLKVLLGPNGSGKTFLSAGLAQALSCAMQTGYVPAESAVVPYFAELRYIPRCVSPGTGSLSSFGVEVRHHLALADISEESGLQLVILDEPGSTTTFEGQGALVYAAGTMIASKGFGIVSTHHHEAADALLHNLRDTVSLHHFSYAVREDRIEFHHRLVLGQAPSLGVEVSRSHSMPEIVTTRAMQLREGLPGPAPFCGDG